MILYWHENNRYKSIKVIQGGQWTWNFWKLGKVREFCGTCKMSGKSQGISWNLEKSGNFNPKLGKVREFYLREMNIAEVLHKNKLMWMSIVILKSCTRTPKSEKISGKVREKSGNFEKLECWPPCLKIVIGNILVGIF